MTYSTFPCYIPGTMREWLKLSVAFVITATLDHFFRIQLPGVLLAEPTTILAVAASVTAATAVTTGVLNYTASQNAAAAQKSLADQQAEQIRSEQQIAAAQAAAQATSGQTFGEDPNYHAATGLGFGSGTPSGSVNSGRATLTGMG